MLTLSPAARFYIGIALTAAIAISQGSVSLAHAIPADWIAPVEAWCGIFAVIGSAIQTGLQGLGMTNVNKVAAALTLPDEGKVAVAQTLPTEAKIAVAQAST